MIAGQIDYRQEMAGLLGGEGGGGGGEAPLPVRGCPRNGKRKLNSCRRLGQASGLYCLPRAVCAWRCSFRAV